MSRPLLLITRPAAEATRTIELARELGFETVVSPLFRITPIPFSLPEHRADAILFTSPRAPEIVASERPDLLSVPVWAVGSRTAELARACGFDVVYVGEGDGSLPIKAAVEAGVQKLWHFSGEVVADWALPDAIQVTRIPVYASAPVPGLSVEAVEDMRANEVFMTLLFSPNAAAHFSELLKEVGLPRARQRIGVISQNAADAAGDGWKKVMVPTRPRLDEMLAGALKLWQDSQDV